jgi:GntR family transcriptional regulator, nutrient-sensing system regulator
MTVATTVTVTAATPADANAIGEIHARSWAATYPAIPPPTLDREHDVWASRIAERAGRRRTLAARADGRIVGFVHLGPSPDADHDPSSTGHIFSIHVEPEVAGTGIGRRLMDAALRQLSADGYVQATLWVVVDNHRARGFYTNLGWRPDGAIRREPLALEERDAGVEVEVHRYVRPFATGRKATTLEPKYYELRQWLREHVDGLPPGTPVAAERALSEQFNMSRTTVRQALHDLAVEGRIVRRQGRGTFVAPPKVTQDLQLTSYTQDMVAQGRRPGAKLVDVAVIDSEADVAAKLGLPERAKVVRLERVRYADGEPMAVETVYLDHERFAEIGDLLTTDGSLYKLLDDRYGVVPVAADETIETVLATPAASRLLGTDSTTPMLLLTRCSSDAAGRPVEYVRSLYRGDRYRFIARIRRPEV